MGVEYRHFMVPATPTWCPKADTLHRVDMLLRKWSLVTADPAVFDLSGGKQQQLSEIPSNAPGHGIAVVYRMVEGPPVAAIFGPSYYPDIPDDERYLDITIVAGLDYRVHSSSEGLCFTVLEPASEAGRKLEPDRDQERLYLFDESYPSGPATVPPRVEVLVGEHMKAHVALSGYQGVWRGALILDCGKELPAFVDGSWQLSSRQFATEVASVFDSPIHEVGEIY